MKAKEFLQEKQTAIVIFTDGRGLKINKNGTGKSGVWVLNKKFVPQKVIIYHRNLDRNINEIFLGDFVQLLPSDEIELPNRSVVEFINMEFVGNSNSNWNKFTETKRGFAMPIKYFK